MTKYEDPIQPDWDSLKLSPLKMVTYLQIATLRAAFKQIAGEIQEFGGGLKTVGEKMKFN